MARFAVLIGLLLFFIAIILVIFKRGTVVKKDEKISMSMEAEIILPKAKYDGPILLERVLHDRRSIRSYTNKPVTLAQFSQLLWAAQGITNKQGFRTAPSAGALYPMELYVVAGNVEDLTAGVYKYNCSNHSLSLVKQGDKRKALAAASLGQYCVLEGAADIVITGIYERTARKYGARAKRYVHMEAGHVSQNIYLQATALGLGTVSVGAFEDDEVKTVIGAQPDEQPLYVMPVGIK